MKKYKLYQHYPNGDKVFITTLLVENAEKARISLANLAYAFNYPLDFEIKISPLMYDIVLYVGKRIAHSLELEK